MTIAARRKESSDVDDAQSSWWSGANGSLPAVWPGSIDFDPLILGGPALACLVDRNGRCVLLNEMMAEALALPPDKVKGSSILDFFPASGPVLARWFALADIGRQLPDRQLAWGGRHYQVAARPVRGVTPGLDALSLTAFDVTRHVRLERRLRASRRRLAALALHDDLTGLLNRRGLELQLQRELRRTRRDQRPLSLLMIDIDRFKAYNDGCGHLQGDSCLRVVSTVLRRSMHRSGDLAGRFGGEEFVVVLPDASAGGAELVAERLRAGVESLWLHHPAADASHVTISVGVASLRIPQDRLSIDHYHAVLMQAADAALYRAKAAGRNRVESCDISLEGRASA